jgi:hypothetical protein
VSSRDEGEEAKKPKREWYLDCTGVEVIVPPTMPAPLASQIRRSAIVLEVTLLQVDAQEIILRERNGQHAQPGVREAVSRLRERDWRLGAS